MKKTIIALCVSTMFGCAHLEALTQKKQAKPPSYVYVTQEISDDDEEMVGEDMARFLAEQYPAAKTTLFIEPSESVFNEALVDGLTKKGFGILPIRPTQGPAIPVAYFVTNLGNGILVRLRYAGKISSRYYGRKSDGSLYASGQIAIREGVK